jgi:16S rRNA (guanine966-N2)-methyltransferase
MRIISGKLKGSALYLTKSKNTRPLKDMVRESIFNLLTHSNKISFDIEKSSVLDLFSGTGSFGLECLSRKAARVFFVEREKNAITILKKNIKKLRLENKTRIFTNDTFKIIKKNIFSPIKFDLIFCDPPFENSNMKELFDLLLDNQILKDNGIIILHRNKSFKERLPDYFRVMDERIYGVSKIIFGKF